MIAQFGGRIIDTADDGILAEFGSVVNAFECAVAIQETMAKRNAEIERQRRRIQYRIGINQGDVIFDDTRVYGDGVNVAARLEALAEPGGICVSERVWEDVQNTFDVAFEDAGKQQLKNISRPVRIFHVRVTGPATNTNIPIRVPTQWKPVYATNGLAKLRVFAAGHGPTVVMLPGVGGGPFALKPLAQLAARLRVVLPEPRGYGESVGPLKGVTLRDLGADVARAIETVGGAPVVVAGHNYGNRLARMLAQDRPDLVRGVVLMAAGGKFPPSAEAAQIAQTLLDQSMPTERRRVAAKMLFFGPQSNPTPDDIDIILDSISSDTSKMQVTAINRAPLESWWPGGKGPMLVIQGLADVIAPPENGRSLKIDYPDRVTLVELAGLGHFMTRERPDLVAEAIIAFVHKLGN
jgi:pimeloyl-ACP methyl ester carboxylesterase